jgi:hypothetical protein
MKKILGIIVLSLVLSGNAYAGWFSKLPVLACEVDGKYYTYDLRKYKDINKKKYSKSNMPKKVILEITDDYYAFSEDVDQGDGTVRMFRYNVNRYSGVLDLYISVKHVRFGKDALRKSLTTEYTANGICKGVK